MENNNQSEPTENKITVQESPDVQRLIDEAEQRGYLRGRNEAAEKIISEPALFQEQHPEMEPFQQSPLLTSRRVSIWDLP